MGSVQVFLLYFREIPVSAHRHDAAMNSPADSPCCAMPERQALRSFRVISGLGVAETSALTGFSSVNFQTNP